MRRRTALLLVVPLLAAACGRGKDLPPNRFDGGPPPRRVIEPPPRDVRALPPHAITGGGVGPYKLRAPLTEIMKALPSGPRMAVLQIPGIVDYAAARDEGLLIGGERQGDASFIAVLREGIARTAEGVGVGAPEEALVRAVGPAVDDPAIVRDPALWVGAGLPGARFVLRDHRVLGVVLAAAPRDGAAPIPATGGGSGVAPAVPLDAGAPPPAACVRAPVTPADVAGLVPMGATYQPACLGAADAVATSGDVVLAVARAVGETKARRIAATEVRGLRWLAPVRAADGKDELVVVTEDRVGGARVHQVVVLRLEGTRLVRVAEEEVYRLDEQSAAWIGAGLADVALRLEVLSHGDALTVSGVLVHASGGQAFTLAPLMPVTVRRRRTAEPDRPRTDADAGAPTATEPDAHARDASLDAP